MIQEINVKAYEMVFVECGSYGIGYKFKGEHIFAKSLKERTVIGDWQIINDKKSEFWYRAR